MAYAQLAGLPARTPRGHRPLHDDRSPPRLCRVRPLAGPRAGPRLVHLVHLAPHPIGVMCGCTPGA